jgi:two-component system CheB/CheR fusion protein
MNNLLSGTGIATVFLDPQLRILRFTPAAAQIINLIPGDIGRPVRHLVSNLVGYDSLATDAQVVLDTLEFREAQVQIRAGNWFTMRVRPYRTVDNVISGVVITFVDITDRVKTQDKLKEATELSRLAVVVRDASDSITVQDLEGRTLAWNPGAVRLYGWSEAQALLMNVRERIPQALRDDELMRVLELSRAEVLAPYRTQRLTRQGDVVEVLLTATALRNEAGTVYAIATTERPIGRPA